MRRYFIPAVCFVVFIVFLVYRPALNNGFVNWDDDVHLLENPFVQGLDPQHLRDIFTTTVNKIYLPLTSLSFAVEYHFVGDRPFLYHFTNVALHAAVTAMAVFFCLRLGLSLAGSVVAALLFGLHPMHVESVAWVTERKDVLYSFFYLGALLCYCGYLKNPKGGFLFLTFVLGFLSVLAKPMAMSLPLVLAVLDWYFKRRLSAGSLIEKAALGLLFLPVVWMTYSLQMRHIHFEFPQSLLMGVWTFTFSLQKFLWPDYFVLLYQVPKPVSLVQPAYLQAVAVFIVLVLGMMVFRRRRVFCFSILFYAASVFFLVRFDQAADANMVADRFMYLPSLGVCALLGRIFEKFFLLLSGHRHLQGMLAGLLALGYAGLAFKTTEQIGVWRSGVSLWSHQLQKQGTVATALIYNKLAEATVAEDAFQRILDHPPGGKEWPGDLSAEQMDMVNKVITLYESALRIKPDYATAYRNLGALYLEAGDWGRAEEHLSQAVSFDPKDFEAFFQLGQLRLRQGRRAEAAVAFQQAVNINLDNRRLIRRIEKILASSDERP
jgi:hypothetical protein